MHLRELQLRLRARPRRERRVAHRVPQRLPLRFVLGKDFALRVVSDHVCVYEAGEVEFFGAEHGHGCGACVGVRVWGCVCGCACVGGRVEECVWMGERGWESGGMWCAV